jgi:hypothetical protein
MKKRLRFIYFLLLLCFAVPAHAQTDSLVITLKKGKTVVLALSQIQKITFDSVKIDAVYDNSRTHNLLVAPSFPNPLQKVQLSILLLLRQESSPLRFTTAKAT